MHLLGVFSSGGAGARVVCSILSAEALSEHTGTVRLAKCAFRMLGKFARQYCSWPKDYLICKGADYFPWAVLPAHLFRPLFSRKNYRPPEIGGLCRPNFSARMSETKTSCRFLALGTGGACHSSCRGDAGHFLRLLCVLFLKGPHFFT